LDPAERIARRRAGRPHGVALLATGEADKRVRCAQDLLRSPVGAGQRFRHVLARPRRVQPLLERADPVFRPELAEKATRPRAPDDLFRRDRRRGGVPRKFEQLVLHDLHRLAQRPRARAPYVDAIADRVGQDVQIRDAAGARELVDGVLRRVAVIVADNGEAVLVRLRVELLRGDLARLEALPAPIEPEIEVVVEGEPRRLAQRLGDRVEGLIAAGDPERGGAAPLDLERLVTDLDALLAAERGLDRAARRRRINRHVALRELLHDGAELGVLLGQPPDLRLLALGNQPAAWAHEEEAARAGGALLGEPEPDGLRHIHQAGQNRPRHRHLRPLFGHAGGLRALLLEPPAPAPLDLPDDGIDVLAERLADNRVDPLLERDQPVQLARDGLNVLARDVVTNRDGRPRLVGVELGEPRDVGARVLLERRLLDRRDVLLDRPTPVFLGQRGRCGLGLRLRHRLPLGRRCGGCRLGLDGRSGRLRLRSGRGRGLRCGLWRRLGRWGGRRLGLRLRPDRARADDRPGEAAESIDGREAALDLAVPRRNRPRGPAGAAHVVVAPAVYVRLAGHPRARRLAQRVGDLGLDHGGRRRLRGGCGRGLGRGRGWALLRRARLGLRSGRWRRRGLLRRGARLLRRLLRGLRGLLRGFGRRGRRGGGLGRGLCLRLRRDLRLRLRRLDRRLARRCGLHRRRAEHDIGNTADGGAERACGEQALAELLERGRVPRGEVLHRVRPRLLRRLRRALGERAGDEP